MPDANGTEANVNIGKRNPEETCPRPLLVSCIETAHTVVKLVSYRVVRDTVERPSDKVPECVTAEHIAADKNNIHDQNDGPNSYSKAVREMECNHCVVGQKAPHNVGEPQKIAMKFCRMSGKLRSPR